MQPHHGKTYPPHLTCVDETFRSVMAGLAELGRQRQSADPTEHCRRFWAVLAPLYVTDPADAPKVQGWGRCELPNERNLMKYMTGAIMPSIARLNLTSEDLSRVEAPVLTVHGTKDRSAPYGGGREWASALPNARLLSMEGAGHAPWIESAERFFRSIEMFLDGAWPEGAVRVEAL